MVKERVWGEEHLDHLQKVDLTLPPDALDLLSRVMGQNIAQPATSSQIERSQTWINSPEKRRVETALGRIVGYLGGRALVGLAGWAVARHDGHQGFITIDVGFLGEEKVYGGSLIKVRTMVPGAQGLLKSPFEHTSFKASAGVQEDQRILPIGLARVLRRTGIDEFPQVVWQVPAGEASLVGARGYIAPELVGTEILIALRDHPRLNLGPEVKGFLASYPAKVDRYQPRPAFIGPLQATLAKDSPHVFRMFGDVAYWERASPLVDFRLFFYTVVRRLQGVGAR